MSQGIATLGDVGLSGDRRARAEDGRQRSGGDRQLSRIWLRCQVCRDVDARGCVRCRLDGEDVNEGFRARGDGPERGLDHRGSRHGGGRGNAGAAGSVVSGDRV